VSGHCYPAYGEACQVISYSQTLATVTAARQRNAILTFFQYITVLFTGDCKDLISTKLNFK
jgi:hypothetical protein